MFHEMTLKLYFMKYSERKFSQCILPFRNFAKFTEKHLCQSLLFNKVAGLKSKVNQFCYAECIENIKPYINIKENGKSK